MFARLPRVVTSLRHSLLSVFPFFVPPGGGGGGGSLSEISRRKNLPAAIQKGNRK
jgi:hypothetical protein